MSWPPVCVEWVILQSSIGEFQKIFSKNFFLDLFIRKQSFNSSFEKGVIKQVIISMDAIGPVSSKQDPCNAKVLNGLPGCMLIEIAQFGCM